MALAGRAIALVGSLVLATAAACTFTEDWEPLQDRDCGTEAKRCIDPDDGVEKCVGLVYPGYGCAATRSCRPCAPEHAVAICSIAGSCDYSVCEDGWGDCDEIRVNGCEEDIAFEIDHCGECNNECDLPHATPTCSNGICRVSQCAAGFTDCDESPFNGCECPDSDVCVDRECTPAGGP